MARWKVPVRIEGPAVGEVLRRGLQTPSMRVGDPDLGMATWELDVQAEGEDDARSQALAALRSEIGDDAYGELERGGGDWNVTPHLVEQPGFIERRSEIDG
jgi:hypothetical protein